MHKQATIFSSLQEILFYSVLINPSLLVHSHYLISSFPSQSRTFLINWLIVNPIEALIPFSSSLDCFITETILKVIISIHWILWFVLMLLFSVVVLTFFTSIICTWENRIVEFIESILELFCLWARIVFVAE